ncbi:hypothetical protein BJ742DRAFT_777474 [Cladochytrium replicatum]|nr:hypothetical protein BJ742DRAFT_777474 [Cladochytrium replicatum]
MNMASKRGRVEVLPIFPPEHVHYTSVAMDEASANSHAVVLDCTLDAAFMDRALVVLDWWRASGLERRYSERCMNLASLRGQIDVLAWWKYSKLELKYSNDTIDLIWNEKLKVLDWWKVSGLALEYSSAALSKQNLDAPYS